MPPSSESLRPSLRSRGTLLASARFASLVFAGMFAGFLITVLGLELSMRDADGAVYTQVRHVELIAMDVLATVTLVPAIIATATVTVLYHRTSTAGRRLVAVALLLLALIVIVTALVNLPINADQRDWLITAPPQNWADIRDRWQLAHAARTAAAVIAFGCVVFAETVGARTQRPFITESPDTQE